MKLLELVNRILVMVNLTPERSAQIIHQMLTHAAGVGRMIMVRSVKQAFIEQGFTEEEFDAGLEHGQATQLFSVGGLGLLRRI